MLLSSYVIAIVTAVIVEIFFYEQKEEMNMSIVIEIIATIVVESATTLAFP